LQKLMFMWGFELTTSKADTSHSTTALAQSKCYRIDVSFLIRIAIWDFSNSYEFFGRNYVFPPSTEIHKFREIRPKFQRNLFPCFTYPILRLSRFALLKIPLNGGAGGGWGHFHIFLEIAVFKSGVSKILVQLIKYKDGYMPSEY
jgi:hypothetical protein